MTFLNQVNPKKSVRLSDISALFPFDKIQSDLRIKSTHKSKTLDQIYLHDYIPRVPIKQAMERHSYSDYSSQGLMF